MRLSERVKTWLEDSRSRARTMLAHGATYHDSIAQLIFFYVRCSLVRHQKLVKVSKVIQLDRNVIRKYTNPPKNELTDEALTCGEEWANSLVSAGATFREAAFVFKRSLIETAIENASGNHLEASRVLKVHRNTVWNVPRTPLEVQGNRLGRKKAS